MNGFNKIICFSILYKKKLIQVTKQIHLVLETVFGTIVKRDRHILFVAYKYKERPRSRLALRINKLLSISMKHYIHFALEIIQTLYILQLLKCYAFGEVVELSCYWSYYLLVILRGCNKIFANNIKKFNANVHTSTI